MSLKFTAKSFDQLSVQELHDALRLRVDIFVVEQACAYPEVDGRDPDCTHVFGRDTVGELIAYCRIVPSHDGGSPHIGRVVVRKDQRSKGIARSLMDFCLSYLETQYGSRNSIVAAQTHLEAFYGSLGYQRQGPDYPWDGILHVDMEIREGPAI